MKAAELESLYKTVRECRLTRHLSLREAAHEMNLPPNTVYGLEYGKDSKLSTVIKVLYWLESEQN